MPGCRLPHLRPTTVLVRCAVILAVAWVAHWPACAAEAPAATVPVPPPVPPARPDALKPPASAEPTRAPGATARPDATSPPSGEGGGAEAGKPELPIPPPTPPERPAELSGESALALKVSPPDDTACRTRLKRLGVDFDPLPAIAEGQCTAPLPLKVTRLADDIALPQAATLTCRAAEALARWATEVQVEADRTLKHRLTGFELGGTFVCRGQNHDVDAKLSEHAFANAVDVMGFAFAGRPGLAVKTYPAGSEDAQFLNDVRTKACGFFRTVLGPGTNAAHANHLHLDERERTAGHRLCE
jgi:hypothetical protein